MIPLIGQYRYLLGLYIWDCRATWPDAAVGRGHVGETGVRAGKRPDRPACVQSEATPRPIARGVAGPGLIDHLLVVPGHGRTSQL